MLPVWGKWVVVAVGCVIAEIFTPSFYILWFGGGALVAALLAGLGFEVAWQFAGFVMVSAALVIFTKPIASRLFTKREETKTNIYGLIGKAGCVTKDIGDDCPGEVRIGGEVWTARSVLGGNIPSGAKVEVVEVKGVRLMVRPLGEEIKCAKTI